MTSNADATAVVARHRSGGGLKEDVEADEEEDEDEDEEDVERPRKEAVTGQGDRGVAR